MLPKQANLVHVKLESYSVYNVIGIVNNCIFMNTAQILCIVNGPFYPI